MTTEEKAALLDRIALAFGWKIEGEYATRVLPEDPRPRELRESHHSTRESDSCHLSNLPGVLYERAQFEDKRFQREQEAAFKWQERARNLASALEAHGAASIRLATAVEDVVRS